jgi:Mn-dependent DtxR family transcriptional regulator
MDKEEFFTFREYMNKDQNKLSACEEDYVEMIYRLCEKDNGFTRVIDIANALNVKPPSVTKMIKKLDTKGYLKYRKYGIVEPHEKGIRVGKELLLRHNTVEAFLNLLFIKEDILEETEKIEHTINADTLIAIRKLVQFFEAYPECKKKYLEFDPNNNLLKVDI